MIVLCWKQITMCAPCFFFLSLVYILYVKLKLTRAHEIQAREEKASVKSVAVSIACRSNRTIFYGNIFSSSITLALFELDSVFRLPQQSIATLNFDQISFSTISMEIIAQAVWIRFCALSIYSLFLLYFFSIWFLFWTWKNKTNTHQFWRKSGYSTLCVCVLMFVFFLFFE